MNWQSMDEFFRMGGYGLYVWGAYGVTLAVMLAEVLALRRRRRLAFDQARAESADGVHTGALR
jgi:heme exporter protein D